MSEVKVNKISPRTACGTVTLGDSGDTFTIPSGATITNSGTASGFGATGETSWDTTVKTTGTFTATAGVGYFLNTTGGIITVNLAAGTAGDSVALADYAGTWQTNNVTVAANGSEKIGGVDIDVNLTTEGQSVTFVYIDGTQGWVNVLDSTSNIRGNAYVTATGGTPCSGAIVCTNYKVHTFTGPGTFTVTNAGAAPGSNTVDYMVLAGGGSGGGRYGGGGGGGGYRESSGAASGCYTVSPLGSGVSALPVTATGYPIVVGGGAAGVPSTPPSDDGNRGTDSSGLGITSTGGGAGAGQAATSPLGPGGSGGGGSYGPSAPVAAGASGNTPPVSPPQGQNGGNGYVPDGPYSTGGGGGATEVGVNATSGNAGRGGAGATSCITGSPVARGGGGGGSGEVGAGPNTAGAASPCGSGTAGAASDTDSASGAVNRGGGTGGSYWPGSSSSGTGGSGVVVIRYKFQ